MLPTLWTLKSALIESLLSCNCRLCVPRGDDSSHSKDVVFKEDRVEDYATLILCGCLFLVRNTTFNRSKNLAEFIITCRRSSRKDDIEIFGGLATQPTVCSVPHEDGPVKWKKWTHLEDVCNKCRWKAFEDAFQLKRTIMNVAKIPGESHPHDLWDMSNYNVPFINLKRPDIKRGRATVRFYSSQIHTDYNTFETKELKEKEIFRKVYAYQYQVESEKKKISEAKEEIRIAHQMSQKHDSVAKLLYAFYNRGFDWEIVELVFKKYDGNLEDLLLGPYAPQDLIPHAGDGSELIDNILWKEMVNVVEAVVALHSFHSYLNPLDLKLANILVDNHEQIRVITLHLADFGHVVETIPRRATVDYAPPGEDEGWWSENETGMTYDVWSMACILLQVLVFIHGGRQKLELFNSNRQAGFSDAAYWYKQDGKFMLRRAVADSLTLLETQKEDGTKLAILKLREMLSVEPEGRGTMVSCLSAFRTAKHDNRPKDQDAMKCGSENWSVFFRNSTISKEHPAHLAIYRDPRRVTEYYDGSEELRRESISIDLNVEVGGYLTRGECSRISFSPAAFFSSEDDSGKKALRFKSILPDYTLLFTNIEEYRRFIALITRQEIVYKDVSSGVTDFMFTQCSITNNERSFSSGRLQVWKRLTKKVYDEKFKRASSPPPYGPDDEERLTVYILVLWTRHASTMKKVCLVIDIGETTWKLERDELRLSRLMIQPKRKPETLWRSQLRAAMYEEEPDPGTRTEDKYPFIPIDPAQLYKGLSTGVAKDLDIDFSSSTERDGFIEVLRRHRFFG